MIQEAYQKKFETLQKVDPGKNFELLKEMIARQQPTNWFVITENHQGFLGKLGVGSEKIWELYGNINFYQCAHGKIYHYKDLGLDGEEVSDGVPMCKCSNPKPVRPNVVFPNDAQWDPKRSDA